MKKTIISGIFAIVAAIVGAALGFFLSQNSIEKTTVETLAGYFDSIEKDTTYEQALKTLYQDAESYKNDNQKLAEENQLLIDECEKLRTQSGISYTDGLADGEVIALEKNITYFLDGTELSDISKHSLIYNGTLYLPLSAVNNIANKEINWDGKESNLYLGIKKSKSNYMIELIPAYQSYGYTEVTGINYVTMGGTKYYNGFYLSCNSVADTYALFNLNGKYTEVSGIIGHVDGSDGKDKKVDIYADGTLIKTFHVGYKDLPQSFTLDVSGILQLRVERSYGYTQTGFCELEIK